MRAVAIIYLPIADIRNVHSSGANGGNGHASFKHADVQAYDRSVLNGKLTERKRDVLALIADGKSNRQITNSLTLSVRTVERHITNIYRTINAKNRTAAALFAFANRVPLASNSC